MQSSVMRNYNKNGVIKMNDKRFTRKDYAIYEKGNPICMTLRDVDVRLNELWEENEQLKARIKYLERKIQRERVSAMKQHEKWEKELNME